MTRRPNGFSRTFNVTGSLESGLVILPDGTIASLSPVMQRTKR